MIAILISVIIVISMITAIEHIRIGKLERYITQAILDIDMLIQNSQTIDK